jgi:uncharacterized protein YggE
MARIGQPYYHAWTKGRQKLVFFTGLVGIELLLLLLLVSVAFDGNNLIINARAQDGSENRLIPENSSSLQAPQLSANLSTVSTSGTATTRVIPDMVSVIVGVQTNGTTAQEAVSRNANLTAQVIGAIMGLGINENEIETSSFSVSPIYESTQQSSQQPPCIDVYPPPPGCEPKQEIVGYSASNSVTVTLSVSAGVNAGQVIDASIQAGANNVNGLYFFVSQDRQQEIRGSLIREAIANARERANIAADAVGMVVSGVQSVNLNDVNFPVFRSEFSTAAGVAADLSPPTQILPGQQEVSTTVTIVYYMVTGRS